MELETIIKQVENITPVEPKPFLATRVRAALQEPSKPAIIGWGKLVPYAVAALLVFNIFTIWNNDADDIKNSFDQEESMVAVEDDSFINQFEIEK